MGSVQSNLQYTTNILVYICPFLLLFLGTFGCLGNLITFTSKKLNKNSCASYLLGTYIFELITLTFGLISRIADQYGSNLQRESRIYCKIRYYFALTFPTVATFLLVMASIDRCMSTSNSIKYRSFCQIKIAHRMILFVIILSMIACSHTLIFVDNQSSCYPQAGIYSLFYSIFIITYCNCFPNTILVVSSLWTIRNKIQARNRIVQRTVLSHQQRANTQFIRIVLSHAILSSVLDTTRLTCYSYYLLAINANNTPYERTVNVFLVQFSLMLSYLSYSKSFYTNTLMSKLFRGVFRETCRSYYHQIKRIFT